MVVTVDKKDNPDHTEYNIEKSTTSETAGFEPTNIDGETLDDSENTFTINGLERATNYYFRTRAKNGDGEFTVHGASEEEALTVPPVPTIDVGPDSNHSIVINWDDVRGDSDDLTYRIYEAGDPDTPVVVLTEVEDETTYTHEGLTPNTVYGYKITAENANGVETEKPSPESAATLATTPEINSLEGRADGEVYIYVDEKDNPENTEYYIEKSTDRSFLTPTQAHDWAELEEGRKLTIEGYDSGKTYYYRIKARNNNQVEGLEIEETGWGYTPPPPPVQQYTITLSAEPEAGGSVSGGGTFIRWARANAEALANFGYEFINWTEGGTEVSSDSSYTFMVAVDRDLVANFESLASSDANLSALEINTGTLDPAFAPGETSYSIAVARDISSIEATATLSGENASMTINGVPATSGEAITIDLGKPGTATEIEIVVTAEDGETEKTYTVNVKRKVSYIVEATLTADPSNWQLKDEDIIFTATVTESNRGAEFAFWYRAPGRDWVKAQPYSTNNTWSISTDYVGKIEVGVQARAKGSEKLEEARVIIDYEITALE